MASAASDITHEAGGYDSLRALDSIFYIIMNEIWDMIHSIYYDIAHEIGRYLFMDTGLIILFYDKEDRDDLL